MLLCEPTFDAADVCTVEISLLCERLLRKTYCLAATTNVAGATNVAPADGPVIDTVGG